MAIEIRVPEVGESVQEAVLAEWFVKDGDAVEKDQALFLLETDKVTLEVPAEGAGVVRLTASAGENVQVGQVVGTIESGEVAKGEEERKEGKSAEKEGKKEEKEGKTEDEEGRRREVGSRAEAVSEEAPAREEEAGSAGEASPEGREEQQLTPSVKRLVAEKGLDPGEIPATGPGGRLTRNDVLLYLEERGGNRAKERTPGEESPPEGDAPPKGAPAAPDTGEGTTRKRLSPIRRRIAERLLEAKRSTAMLTTFNEADLGAVMELRRKYKSPFTVKHGVGLGITSFFVMAAAQALRAFPQVNAFIEGDEIVYHDYVHMGIAIGAERGLVVPVIRHAQRLGAAAIEKAIAEFADKVRENKLELSDLEGGTFTITNGGVFGSLLSTPILNPPQSAILGLHKVEQRPVAVEGEVVVRPMMYLALSYDHRIIDGRDAVQFLVRIKELIEAPERLWLEV
ncbi:MAG: 2-oxoglutarate dehydrogenase complex dihydrolipoyllysine-residue succinyltransferase [Deferrisomatales bacterium]|nr:2-oxoglutarate dehydrogenase complex dihydrolipoyllysine-residue succinyltransferase [Deferrisomatales bacterium]